MTKKKLPSKKNSFAIFEMHQSLRLPKKAAPTTRFGGSQVAESGFHAAVSDEALQRLKEELAASDEAK